jgi:hypothetical protein
MSDKLNSNVSFHCLDGHKLPFTTHFISLLYVQSDVTIVTDNMRKRQMQSRPYRKAAQLQTDVNLLTVAVCQTRTKTHTHTHTHTHTCMYVSP